MGNRTPVTAIDAPFKDAWTHNAPRVPVDRRGLPPARRSNASRVRHERRQDLVGLHTTPDKVGGLTFEEPHAICRVDLPAPHRRDVATCYQTNRPFIVISLTGSLGRALSGCPQ